MNDPMAGWLVPTTMFGLMFGMGLSLTWSDFRRIAELPGPVITGTLLQLVAMPTVGFALATAFELPPMLAVGFVICAACPGGLGSNLFVHFGRASTALSISLTATATMVTLFTLPLWIRAVQDQFGGAMGGVEIPLFDTAIELGGLTVLPVLLGMTLRSYRPGAGRFERPLTGISAVVLLTDLLVDNFDRPEVPTELFLASLAPSIGLVLAALLLGLVIPQLLRQSASDTVTIAVELCLKNSLLGVVVVTTSFGEIEATIPLIVYSTLMTPPALLCLVVYRVRASRQQKRAAEETAT